jgi:hydroxymethylbilane synthase
VTAEFLIGTRGSKLALAQTNIVADRIKALFPAVNVRLVKITTHGDRDQSLKMDFAEQDGVFVRELERALLDGRIDMAVHSLKDVPTQLLPGLTLAAVLEREDPRDVLITRGISLAALPPMAKVGTSSLRRSVQLMALRPDVVCTGIRGNVDTRLRKVADGEYDGVVLAAAGLSRLGCADRITEFLPLDRFLPAVGQAALVIETRADDKKTSEITSCINHLPTWQSVMAERAFLWELGGGCSAPIAALGTVAGRELRLEGLVAGANTRHMVRAAETGETGTAEGTGKRLAHRLLDMGGRELMAEAATA